MFVDRYRCIQAFVRVAERQSFAEAARQLGVAPSVITSRVRQLEKLVRAPLFHRSTRKVTLSEAGKACFEECADLLGRFESVADHVRLTHETPTGLLRVQVLPGFALSHLGCAMKEFRETYPQIDLDLTVSDSTMNPADGGFDISLQIFRPSAETLVIERRLFGVRRVFCASPEYLRRYGEPGQPRDLLKHTLGLYSAYPTRNRWTFNRIGEEEISLDLPAHIRSNSVHFLRDFARSGGGVTCLPTLVCAEDLAAGALVPILEDYHLPPLELLAIYPVTHRGATKVRLFVEFIAQSFCGELDWDRPLRSAKRKQGAESRMALVSTSA